MIAQAPVLNDRVSKLKTLREQYIRDKSMFTTQYEVLLQYFYQTKRSASFLGTTQNFQGEFLNDGSIVDNYGAYCAETMASVITGYLWKGEKGTVRIVPGKNIQIDENIRDYFVRITNDFSTYLENKKSRFETSLSLAVLEMVILGTAAMVGQRGDYKTPLRFQERCVISFFLGFDENGNVDTIGFDRYDTARQIVDKYGVTKCPSIVQQAYKENNISSRFVVTELIRPRKNPVAKEGKLSLPFEVVEFMPNESAFLGEGGLRNIPRICSVRYKIRIRILWAQ